MNPIIDIGRRGKTNPKRSKAEDLIGIKETEKREKETDEKEKDGKEREGNEKEEGKKIEEIVVIVSAEVRNENIEIKVHNIVEIGGRAIKVLNSIDGIGIRNVPKDENRNFSFGEVNVNIQGQNFIIYGRIDVVNGIVIKAGNINIVTKMVRDNNKRMVWGYLVLKAIIRKDGIRVLKKINLVFWTVQNGIIGTVSKNMKNRIKNFKNYILAEKDKTRVNFRTGENWLNIGRIVARNDVN